MGAVASKSTPARMAASYRDRDPVGYDADAPPATVGILMLDTSFQRFLGDVGNEETWPFPVRFRVVPGATAERATLQRDESLLEGFVRAGIELAAEGVDGIATSCGFLSLYQRALAARLPVPVAASALLQIPMVEATLAPGRRVGVLTYNAQTMGPAHLAAAGAATDTPVEGLDPTGGFRNDLLGGPPTSFAAREAEVLDAARRLSRRLPKLGAIVCECTNFAPHSAAIADELDVPVYDIVTMVNWFQAGLRPRRWRKRDGED